MIVRRSAIAICSYDTRKQTEEELNIALCSQFLKSFDKQIPRHITDPKITARCYHSTQLSAHYLFLGLPLLGVKNMSRIQTPTIILSNLK